MILEIKSLKILDTLKVIYKGREYWVSVLMKFKDGEILEVKILGICEFPGNPMSSRSPRSEEEKYIIEQLERMDKEEIVKLLEEGSTKLL